MFLLRRSAARAITAAPSKAVFTKPHSITTITPATFRPKQQQWILSSFQRRWASDEASKEAVKTEVSGTASVPEQLEGFAQTAAEAPVDSNLTPAQEPAEVEPTDASATIEVEALESTAAQAEQYNPRRNRLESTPAVPNNTVYVGNLYYKVSRDQLQRVFSRFGAIKSVKIISDNKGLSRGFGYVEYESVSDAQSAVDNLDMQVFEGRNLVVQFTRPRKIAEKKIVEPSPPSKTLFIGNMSFEMSDKDLNDLFRDIRNVIDVRVAIDRRTGQPRGFAHADFIDVASATRAKDILGQKVIYERQLRVDYSKSGTRQQRDALAHDTN